MKDSYWYFENGKWIYPKRLEKQFIEESEEITLILNKYKRNWTTESLVKPKKDLQFATSFFYALKRLFPKVHFNTEIFHVIYADGSMESLGLFGKIYEIQRNYKLPKLREPEFFSYSSYEDFLPSSQSIEVNVIIIEFSGVTKTGILEYSEV